MKHIFLINPVAGGIKGVKETLRDFLSQTSYDWEFYVCQGVGDATEFVRKRAESGEEIRFYACGGDGTLQETAVGTYGFPNASCSCYPAGSGNDFVKYYGGAARFRDLAALLEGENVLVDLLQVNDRFSFNVVNFGLDTEVARTMSALRGKPLVGGHFSYTVGVVNALITAMHTPVRVLCDGEVFYDGDCLLGTIANGQYVGGSFRCAPRADNADGFLDVCIVRPVSRARFVRVAGKYQRGEHLDDPTLSDIICYRRCKTVEVESSGKNFAYTLDGEIVSKPSFSVSVLPRVIRFGVPAVKTDEAQRSPAPAPHRIPVSADAK